MNDCSTIDFAEALKYVKYHGEKVSRKIWKDGVYIYLGENNMIISINKTQGKRLFKPYQVDMLADDWYIVDT